MRTLIRKNSTVENVLRRIKWNVVKPTSRKFFRIKLKISGFQGDPYRILFLSPEALVYTADPPGDVANPTAAIGVVRDGDWDRDRFPVEELLPVKGVKDRFINGKRWEETAYYKSLLDRLARGEQPYDCLSKDDIDEHCRYIDRLFEEIKANGYRSQSELGEERFGKFCRIEHEIAVHIDRDGQFLFCDGRRRLAIVRALNIEKIPVIVCVRHRQWEEFRRQILGLAGKNGNNGVLPALTHPDLQIDRARKSDPRYDMIVGHLHQSKGALLDIGANWGYFCHRFEELGFECCALEPAADRLYFLEKLKKAEGRQFRVVDKSIVDFHEDRHFDVVLALNGLDRFLDTKDAYDRFMERLERMDADLLFLEAPDTKAKQTKESFTNVQPDELIACVRQHSCLTKSQLIGYTPEGNRLYKLWR